MNRPALEQALRALRQSTADASVEELQEAHRRGLLPTGVLNWLLACRTPIAA